MIIKKLKGLVRGVQRRSRRQKANRVLAKLREHESPEVRAMGMAILEVLSNDFSAEEQKQITAIEDRRTSLSASEAEIEYIDFGAGKPGSNRTEEEMEQGVVSRAQVSRICKASKPAFWASILYKLIRKLGPGSCVELGTCVGISASYQATALAINGGGILRTLEGSPGIARIAEETFAGLSLSNVKVVTGPFQSTLQAVLEDSKPIDFFFNDGHHDHDAVIRYFNEAMPFLANNAVIVFDDISWSAGMKKAWSEIETDKRVAATISLGVVGIALMGPKVTPEVKLRLHL